MSVPLPQESSFNQSDGLGVQSQSHPHEREENWIPRRGSCIESAAEPATTMTTSTPASGSGRSCKSCTAMDTATKKEDSGICTGSASPKTPTPGVKDYDPDRDHNFNTKLQEEIQVIYEHLDLLDSRSRLRDVRVRARAKTRTKTKIPVTADPDYAEQLTNELPPLPPMIDLLRATHSELIRNLVATHQELNHLKTLLTNRDRQCGPPSITNLAVELDGSQCQITTLLPFTADHDLRVTSFFDFDASQTSLNNLQTPTPTPGQSIKSLDLQLIPSKEFHARLLQDVQDSQTDGAVTVSQTYFEKNGDGGEDDNDNDNEPLETLLLNERTMKHTLLYINPKLPSRLTAVTATTCSCSGCNFEESEMDLELKKLFTRLPPVSHTLYLQPTSHERDQRDSVPKIDSFYGTKDLKKFGHASYFMPRLSPSKRRLVGWRPSYRRGKRKYHSNLFRSTTDPGSFTFCEWIGKLTVPNGVESALLSSCHSLESLGPLQKRGPKIFPLIRKQFCQQDSFMESELSLPSPSMIELHDQKAARARARRQRRFRRVLNFLLPCWWEPPRPEDDKDEAEVEDWQRPPPPPATVPKRILRAACGWCMGADEGSSAHDIATESNAGSTEFTAARPPPRVLVPVSPGPKKHHHHWLLPPPPSPSTSPSHSHACGAAIMKQLPDNYLSNTSSHSAN